MEQSYKIIMWRKCEADDIGFDDIAKRAYETIMVSQIWASKYQPNYKTVRSLKDAKLFDWSYENFYDTLKAGVNREGQTIFQDLGYSCRFFSSTNSNESCGYGLTVGNTNNLFVNDFTVDLPIGMGVFQKEMSGEIEAFFRQATNVFEPFWGCVVNSFMHNEMAYLNKEKSFPTEFHWLNYLSDEMMSKVNPKAVKKLAKKHPEFECDGNIIKLQNIALDANKPEDVALKNEVDKALVR